MRTRRALASLVLLSPFSFLADGADLSISVQNSSAGTSVLLSGVLSPGSASVASLQFDLQYSSSALALAFVPGAAARNAGKTLYSVNLSPNQQRFLVTGLNQNPLPQGSVIDFFININSNAAAGLQPLTISNFTCSDIAGNAISTTFSSGGVNVGSSGSRIQASEVLNAASLTSGPIAPGEILTLFGSGIGPATGTQPSTPPTSTMLAGTTIQFDGTPAPLLYAGPNQINAIVPFGIAGQATTNVVIESGGELVGGFPLSVAPAAPAIFTVNSSGSGSGAILNQDLTLNSPSNPAERGSVVVLYATGAGSMSAPLNDGQVVENSSYVSVLPVVVTIGGVAAQVLYSGAAPGLVAGVLQVNSVVPQNVTPGDSVSIGLTVGTFSSPSGVVLAVR